MPCPRSRSLLKWSTFYISSLTQITKITKVCRRRSPRATSCQRTKRRPSTPFAPRPWTAPIQRSPQPLNIKSPMPPHPLAFLFSPIMACWIMFTAAQKRVVQLSCQGDAFHVCRWRRATSSTSTTWRSCVPTPRISSLKRKPQTLPARCEVVVVWRKKIERMRMPH